MREHEDYDGFLEARDRLAEKGSVAPEGINPEIVRRLSVQRQWPQHFARCPGCVSGRCGLCLGTRKVTKATVQQLLAEERARAA